MRTGELIIDSGFIEYFIIPIKFEEIKNYKTRFGFFLSPILANSSVLFEYLIITRYKPSFKYRTKKSIISRPIHNAEFVDTRLYFQEPMILRKEIPITNQDLRKIFTIIFNAIGKAYDSDSEFWAKSEDYFTILNKLWPDD